MKQKMDLLKACLMTIATILNFIVKLQSWMRWTASLKFKKSTKTNSTSGRTFTLSPSSLSSKKIKWSTKSHVTKWSKTSLTVCSFSASRSSSSLWWLRIFSSVKNFPSLFLTFTWMARVLFAQFFCTCSCCPNFRHASRCLSTLATKRVNSPTQD